MSDLPGESTGVSDLFSQDLDVAHHDIYDRHEFGKAFPIPGFPGAVLASGAPKPGSSMAPARADHQHVLSSSAIRGTLIGSSPVLASGDIPAGVLGSLNPVAIPNSQINIASVQYARYITLTAGFRATAPAAATPTPMTVGVEVWVSQGGGGFTTLFGKLASVGGATPTTTNPATAGPEWTGIMQLNAATAYAFQLAAWVSNSTATVLATAARMFYQIVPAAPVG